ncbi:MAG: QueT transporter family protein [Clostridia bacterium]
MKKTTIKLICINATIASLYFVLTVFTQTIAFGPIQLRLGEALTILPCLIPSSYIGLSIGCLISNIMSPYGIWDMIFGTIITFIAGILTSKIKDPKLAALPPILLNAFFLPILWLFNSANAIYIINVLTTALSQAVILYLIGVPFYYLTKKRILPLINLPNNITLK